MSSSKERRQQKIPQGSYPWKEAVNPLGAVGAPSSQPARPQGGHPPPGVPAKKRHTCWRRCWSGTTCSRPAYLQAGILLNGICIRSEEGTPQGGHLSPLLANVIIDDLDKELEKRGHKFVRYADDCNVYVKTRRADERVMESVKRFVEERLKLKVNVQKSAVDRPWKRKFLGFSLPGKKSPVSD